MTSVRSIFWLGAFLALTGWGSVSFAAQASMSGGEAAPLMSALAPLPVRANIAGVPFFAQEPNQCGPAALAMVAQFAGVKVRPEELTEQVFLPGRQGSLQLEMLAGTRRQGLLAYKLAPRLDDLFREVAAGHPVVVLQNVGFGFSPTWHYAVVVAFDRDAGTLHLHSGATERLEMTISAFEKSWSTGQQWAMVALESSRLPVTAESEAFLASAASLERVHPLAASKAYTSALQAWPKLRAGLLGLGNTAYALGRLDAAGDAFDQATRHHPNFADGWNNLAQVRMEQGRLNEASEAIAKAISLGGERAPRYLSLQASIQSKLSEQLASAETKPQNVRTASAD